MPVEGKLRMDDRPGFGMTLNPAVELVPYAEYKSEPKAKLAKMASVANGK